MGYNVILTGASNQKDGGVDLIAVPKVATLGSVVIAGQVKHHQGDQKTGRDAVDRLLAWKDSRYFGVGLLATNTAFTKDAIWTAQQERNAGFLRLRDFMDLKRWLQCQWGTEEDWREIPDRVELAPGVVIDIPRPRIASVFEDQGLLRDIAPAKNPARETMKNNVLGQCRLCLNEAELQNSHFIPQAAYKRVRGEGTNPNPIVVQDGKAIQTSAQTRAHLLCHDCEQRLSKNGEHTFFLELLPWAGEV